MFNAYFKSSDNQFGFKTKIGCPDAIYTLRKVVEYFVENDSTVNLCFLDMEKAFDKLNHFVLFMKLMERRIPVLLIKLLNCWYNTSSNYVRWEGENSEPYKLLSGVRQGGCLSPVLFIIYVDDMLNSMNNYGCKIFGLSVGAIMYADDLVLIAPSIAELQRMINTCCHELSQLNLTINVKKSAARRI
jgi:hypothetical protein